MKTKPDWVQLRIERWKNQHDDRNIEVRFREMQGCRVRLDEYPEWFAKTDRFRVGPCTTLEECLEELERLETLWTRHHSLHELRSMR